ncbi:MAG: hypothetical protein HGA90_05590, partial [Alphaproteobacteria bacterium]|nr:hypothetical protein [Alphaproteobacteria bacterium]
PYMNPRLKHSHKDVLNEVWGDATTQLISGPDAHAYLVAFHCGLHSSHVFEDHIVSQMKEAWHCYASEPHQENPLKGHMEAVFRDGHLVRKNIPPSLLRRPSKENVALDLADLSPEKSALVFCDTRDSARDLVTTLCSKKKTTPYTITLTHADSCALQHIEKHLSGLPHLGSGSVTLNFEAIGKAINSTLFKANAVFVCTPIKTTSPQDFDLDGILCRQWMKRDHASADKGGKILHLAGNRSCSGATTGPWLELSTEKHCFVPYTHIMQEQNARNGCVRKAIPVAEAAIEALTFCRVNNDRAIALTLDFERMGYRLEVAGHPQVEVRTGYLRPALPHPSSQRSFTPPPPAP